MKNFVLFSLIVIIITLNINVFGSGLDAVEFLNGVGEFDKSNAQIAKNRFWDGSNFLLFEKDTNSCTTTVCISDDGINIKNTVILEGLLNIKFVKPIGDYILIFQYATNYNENAHSKYGGYNNGNVIVLNYDYQIIKEFTLGNYNEFLGYDSTGNMYLCNNDYGDVSSKMARQGLSYLYAKKTYYYTSDGINMIDIQSNTISDVVLYDDLVLTRLHLPYYDFRSISINLENATNKVVFENINELQQIYPYYNNQKVFYNDTKVEEIYTRRLSLTGMYGVDITGIYTPVCWYNYDYLYISECDMNYYRIPMHYLTNDIYVCYNETILGFSVPPTTENDRTLVPMRFLFEQMGAGVTWDDVTQSVTVTKDNYTVKFAIDNQIAFVNGVSKQMDVPARLISNKTMIPLRFLSEELGCTVEWDEETKTVYIND